MYTLQELSDRMEILDVIARYSAAVDGHLWDLLDEVFTPDADLDFMYIAGFRGNRDELRAWLSGGLPDGRNYFHLMGAANVVLDGPDEAHAVTPCLNPAPLPDGGLCMFGHWYRDRFVRTPEGWRIAARELELCFFTPLTVKGVDHFSSPWPGPPDAGS
jgi:SnoaL-like domain